VNRTTRAELISATIRDRISSDGGRLDERGLLDKYATAELGAYEAALYKFLETRHPAMLTTIADTRQIPAPLERVLGRLLEEFAAVWTTPAIAAKA